MIIAARPNLLVLKQFQEHGIPIWYARLRCNDDQTKEMGFPTKWPQSSVSRFDLHKAPELAAFAVITGHLVDVIDVDSKNGADPDDMHQRLLDHGVLIIAIATTPSGGKHFYVSSVGLGSSMGIEQGVDFLGGGKPGQSRSCAFTPGTVRPKYPQGGYEWEQEPDWSLLGVDVEKVRAFVLSMKKKQANTHCALKSPATPVEPSGLLAGDIQVSIQSIATEAVGRRNHTLYRETAKLACKGMLTSEEQDSISDVALTSGLTASEIQGTIDSADRAGQGQRVLAMQWRDEVLSSLEVRRLTRSSVVHSVVAFAEKFAVHGPDSLGFSCRELAQVINMKAKTASLAIKTLLKHGYIEKAKRRGGSGNLGQSCRYSMSSPESFTSAEVKTKDTTYDNQEKSLETDRDMHQKGNNHSEETYIYISTSDDCYLFDVSPERVSQIHAHGAFTRLGREVSLPSKLALTVAAIESGRLSVSDIVDATGVGRATTRHHLKILQSMGLITYDAQKTRKVTREWEGDVLDALEDWCQLKAVAGRVEYMREKHQSEREVNARTIEVYLEVNQQMEREMAEESKDQMRFGITVREAAERHRKGLEIVRRRLAEEYRLDLEKATADFARYQVKPIESL